MSARAAVCLCVAADSIEADLRLAREHRQRIDMVELRVDHLRNEEAGLAGRFPGLVDLPVILTVRRIRDGGRFGGEERERAALLDRLAGTGFAYVDIEEDFEPPGLSARIGSVGARVIRSLHDYAGVPQDLGRRVRALAHDGREIPKAAVMPKGTADLARLLAGIESLRGTEKILLGMGDVGLPTRVLASKLGSFLCYATPPNGAVAPGQVDPATLEELYRFRTLGARTAVYGVIGNPVMHSRSPLIHNRGLAALGIDAVYLPFPVDDLDAFWQVADMLGIRGLSVTVPHKGGVIAGNVVPDTLVKSIGACNTLVRAQGTGPWTGTNTDVAGFLGPLRAEYGGDKSAEYGGDLPAGLAATVIGAGGAARAVVHALVSNGARVLVLNRSAERGSALAAAFSLPHAGLDDAGYLRARQFADLIVQTTSVGMAPDFLADPAPGLRFTGREVVYELIYAPRTTAFLQRAVDAGCRVIRGYQMLMAQAMAQFLLFTGSEFPAETRKELEVEPD